MPATAPVPGPTGPTPNDFACFYLYGLSHHPYRQSADYEKLGELYRLVVGAHGGLGLAGSFHPYQLLSAAGVSVWYAAYAQFYAQPNRVELFGEMTLEKTPFLVAPPASFSEYHAWPDARLMPGENPVFSRHLPFVVPFLVRKSPEALRWDAETAAAAAADPDRLRWYVEAVKEALRVVQPAPAVLLGFAEFDEQHPEHVVDKFMRCRDLL